jgi:hypothetical protein
VRQRIIAAVLAIAAMLTLGQPVQAATLIPGSSAVTQPAVTTYLRDDGWPGLVVFTIGADQFVYYAFNPVPENPRTWDGWHRLGNTRFTGTLAAAHHQGVGVEVFGRAVDDRVMHARVQPGGHWEPWEQLVQGETLGSPTVAYDGAGRPEVFVHGKDGMLFHTGSTGPGFRAWRAWARVPAPQRMHGSPIAKAINNNPEVYYYGQDRQVMRTVRTAPGVYATATTVSRIDGAHEGRLGVAAYRERDGRPFPVVMTSTPAGGLATKLHAIGGFDPWFETWGNLHVEGLSGADDPRDGAAVMYGRFTDSRYYRQRLTNGFTDGWERVGDGEFSAPPSAYFFAAAGKHFVFGRGLNGQIFVSHETGIYQRTWSTWHLIGNNV